VQTAILGLENVIFVYLAINMAMKAELTVGMVFAYQAYKQQFLGAGTRLVEAVLNWQLNSVHLARIAEITLAPPEAGAVGTGVERAPLTGRIELRGVQFSYGAGEPEVPKGIDLIVEAGETLTITGPSGGGKTTLMKIMLGLLEPTAGVVLVDGIPLATYGKAAYRHQIGAVMQDDLLYAGSIAENIALFDPEIDMERVRAVAAQAAIASEIERMPMGYESLVGDMGSSLSGGQRQRVLIARALYRTPVYIFADEVTASLDPDNHARVGNALAGVAATKIIVTHRAFMGSAGRLIVVQTAARKKKILSVAQRNETGHRHALHCVKGQGSLQADAATHRERHSCRRWPLRNAAATPGRRPRPAVAGTVRNGDRSPAPGGGNMRVGSQD